MNAIVETPSGRLRGEEVKGILLFRGIPYARPPVGPLRFRPPRPAKPWAGVRDALEAAPAAPQTRPVAGRIGRLLPLGASRQDEDCLALNVWTPACDGARRPVMVWVHGGAFVMGSGATAVYSGRRLARRGDVVVVTLNYRLGALGFLTLEAERGAEGPVATNLGLRDQIAALAWVREHIEAFGGDPENVTLFGESAGGMSVGCLLASPLARGLFHRAVLQSGAAHNASSPDRAARVARAFCDALGVRPERPERLREAPVDAILDAQTQAALRLGLQHGTLPWQPVWGDDVLPEAPVRAAAAGRSARVPVLVGTNRDEWKLFTVADRRSRSLDEARLRRRLARVLPGDDAHGTPLAERALQVYRGAHSGRAEVSPAEIWVAFQTDRVFRHPAARLAEFHARHEPRTYAYLFTWAPSLLRTRIGACHAIEIPFVFGTLRHPVLRPLFGTSRSADALARTVQRAWLAFARSGDPAVPELESWPGYSAERRATMELGPVCRVHEAPFEAERRFWQELEDAGLGSAPQAPSPPSTAS